MALAPVERVRHVSDEVGDRGRVVFSFGDLELEFRAEAVEVD